MWSASRPWPVISWNSPPPKRLGLARGRDRGGGDSDLLECRRLGRGQGLDLVAVAARRGRDGGRRAPQLTLPHPIHVREVARLAAHDSHAGAALGAALHAL